MKNFIPRHLRKKYNNKSGAGDATKAKAFRRVAAVSKRYINQSASALASPQLAPGYADYCNKTRAGTGFRKGA